MTDSVALGLAAVALGAANAGTPPLYRAKLRGLKSDGVRKMDITVTSGSNVVSSATYAFGTGDIGKSIGILSAFPPVMSAGIYQGPSATGGPLIGTITGVSGGNALLSISASASVSGTAYAQFGTDDHDALQALINAIATSGGGIVNTSAGCFSGMIQFEGITIIGSPLFGQSNVGYNGQGMYSTAIVWLSQAAQTTAALFQYPTPTYNTPWTNVSWSNLELDLSLYVVTSYSVYQKPIGGETFRNIFIDHCWIHDSPASGIGIDYFQYGRITNNQIDNCGRLAGSGTSYGGSCIGIGTAVTAYPDGGVISGNVVKMPVNGGGNYGIFVEAQAGQSVYSQYIVSNNVIIVGKTAQTGIAISGCFNTIVSGNSIRGTGATSQKGINVDLGTLPTATAAPIGRVCDNMIQNCDIGIYYLVSGASEYITSPFNFADNTIYGCVRYAYWISTGASIVVDGIKIEGGSTWSNGAAAIYLSGTAGLKNLSIHGVKSFANGLTTATATQQAALSINIPVNGLSLRNCEFYDDAAGKQLYGIIINGVAVTNADWQVNNFAGNATGPLSLASGGTVAGWVSSNKGYNPLGTATVSLGASPATYTAGNTPETLYVTATTVSASKNSITLPGPAASTVVELQPGEAVTITYTGTATAVTDRR